MMVRRWKWRARVRVWRFKLTRGDFGKRGIRNKELDDGVPVDFEFANLSVEV